MQPDDHVIVIGGGLAGVCTAYALARRGARATLLEANPALASEASFANGGLLSASMPEPWNSPGVGRHLLASLFDPAAVMKLRLAAIPGLTRWGLTFLRNSTLARHRATAQSNYGLTRYSLMRTHQLADELDLQHDASSVGILKIFATREAMQPTMDLARLLEPSGLRYELLSPNQIVDREPALCGAHATIAGGVYYPDDTAGDAHAFTCALAQHAQLLGVEIKTGYVVDRIVTRNGQVCGIDSAHGPMTAKHVVIAGGVGSPALARTAGVHLPIKPGKGYSVTVDTSNWEHLPALPIVDDERHVAVTPLGCRLRAVGVAEFAGLNTSIDSRRVDELLRFIGQLYPQLAHQLAGAAVSSWACLRPISADGRPFVGAMGPAGLWANTGHGQLGWTMATGSADLLAAQMFGETPPVDPEPFRALR